MRNLWLESNDLAHLSQSLKCCRAPKGEVTIIRSDIHYTVDSAQGKFKPTVEFMFVNSKYFPQRITWVHDGARTAKRPAQYRNNGRTIRQKEGLHLINHCCRSLERREQVPNVRAAEEGP